MLKSKLSTSGIIFILIGMGFTFPALAQRKTASSPSKVAATNKPKCLSTIDIDTTYDRFANQSLRMLFLGFLNETDRLNLGYAFSGQVLTKSPLNINFQVISSPPTFISTTKPQAIFIIDGRRLILNSTGCSNMDPYHCDFNLSIPVLTQIANGEAVEFKLHQNEYSISKESLEAIKEFIRSTNPFYQGCER